MKSQDLLLLADKLLEEACEANRYRDAEIMQGIDGEKNHAKTVLEWVNRLSKNPPIELQLAALFHDIDRVITPGVGGGFKGDRKGSEYEQHKKAHAKRSADYLRTKLLEQHTPSDLIDRIYFLISHHDDTGKEVESFQDDDLNYLVAADSFAFFSSIAPKLYKAEGEQRLKDKIKFMVEKMPVSTKKLLQSQKLDDEVFERLKNEAIAEVSK